MVVSAVKIVVEMAKRGDVLAQRKKRRFYRKGRFIASSPIVLWIPVFGFVTVVNPPSYKYLYHA